MREDAHLFEYANHRIHPSLGVDSFLLPATAVHSQGLHERLKVDAKRVLLVSFHLRVGKLLERSDSRLRAGCGTSRDGSTRRDHCRVHNINKCIIVVASMLQGRFKVV